MHLKSHIFIVRDWVLGQSLTIILLRFFTQCSLRNITFRTLRFFHFSMWNGALTSAFSSTSVNLPLFWFYLGGALTLAFSRSVVRSPAGPRAHSLARLVEIWSGLVWRGLMKTAVQDSHFFLEQQWPPLNLTDASWLFKNKKLSVGNLLLFFNKMLACVGCIFKALYMALRVSLYLSSSIWGMPRDLSYDHVCVVVGLCAVFV